MRAYLIRNAYYIRTLPHQREIWPRPFSAQLLLARRPSGASFTARSFCSPHSLDRARRSVAPALVNDFTSDDCQVDPRFQ